MTAQKNSGFTLLEVSIVLAIIGLLVGGALGGKALLHQAKLQKALTEAQQSRLAITNFQQQYNEYPGDLTNANAYWPEANNGDGDKKIEYAEEGALMWRHLQLSGLISGNFTGILIDKTPPHGTKGDTNAPASAFFKDAAWFSATGGYVPAGIPMWTFITNIPVGKNYVALGGRWYNNPTVGAIFTPQEAYNIDKKIDDGIANSGLVATNGGQINANTVGPESGAENFSTNCVSGPSYLLTVIGPQCFIAFILP